MEMPSPKAQLADYTVSGVQYAPGIWAHHFLSYATATATATADLEANLVEEQHLHELKEEVRRMLKSSAAGNQTSVMFDMIDTIQRLGLSNHFENEITEILKQMAQNGCGTKEDDHNDLYTSALRFRLLRQHGHTVSCDVFNKFKQSNGLTFKESITNDIVGLLSLYEATHLRFHGEDILEEALTFTRIHLNSVAPSLSSLLSKQVTHALYQPLWKGFSGLEARHYMSVYEEDDSHDQTLLTLAKLDFNFVQKIYQKELCDMTRWWNKLNLANKLPFAKDRLVESYFWALMTTNEPKYHFSRMLVCIYLALTTIIDDIFDVYGVYEHLERFTEAIQRWDISAVDQLQLPECLADCYKGLLDSYSGFEVKLEEQGNLYCKEYTREAVKVLVKAYFQEAKWWKEKHTPTMEEYIPNGLNASFYSMAITAFVGMEGLVTKDLMDWVLSDPKILKATSLIGRLLNDIAGHKFEQNNEQVPSSIECYMKQYGVQEEEAKLAINKQKEEAWKELNEEWFQLHISNTIPKPFLQIMLDLARSSEVLYNNMEGFVKSEGIKDFVNVLLIEQVHV